MSITQGRGVDTGMLDCIVRLQSAASSGLAGPHNANMSDESQIVVPPSFMALFLAPGRSKPTAARDVIAARHDFCEDLATLLTETAATQQWQLGVTEADVLQRVHRGLLLDANLVDAPEAQWVVCRLAEMLGWPMPAFDAAADAA